MSARQEEANHKGKKTFCFRCRSDWGHGWQSCQRCGWGHATDKGPCD